MTVLNIAILTARLQMLKTNIDYAARILEEDKQQEAQKLSEEIDGLLNIEANEENLEGIQEFIEDNEGKVSHLNEEALIIGLEYSAGQN